MLATADSFMCVAVLETQLTALGHMVRDCSEVPLTGVCTALIKLLEAQQSDQLWQPWLTGTLVPAVGALLWPLASPLASDALGVTLCLNLLTSHTHVGSVVGRAAAGSALISLGASHALCHRAAAAIRAAIAPHLGCVWEVRNVQSQVEPMPAPSLPMLGSACVGSARLELT